jgi:hypothetical protein
VFLELLSHLLIPVTVASVAWLLLRRANELCAVRIEGGRPRLLRGRVPSGLLGDIEDIVRRGQVDGVTLRVVSEGGAPRLIPPDVPDAVAQQLRNAIGRHQLLHFRTGRRG